MAEMINQIITFFEVPSSLLDTEHALVLLLLLYGLLTYRHKGLLKWTSVMILAGILLAVFTPFHKMDLLWPLITGLVVPPMLWEAAISVTKSGPLRRNWSVVIWAATLVLLILSLRFFSSLPVSNAILLAILAVTIVWYFRELDVERSYLSTLGQITLAVLLVEVDIAVVSIRQWVGTLFAGIAVGFAIGFIGITLFRKMRLGKWKNFFFFAWAYAAYLSGIVFHISAIATTLAAALVVAAYGYSIGLWFRQKDIPLPSNVPIFFYLLSGLWMLLGWQAHIVVNVSKLAGIPVALIVITVAIFIMQWVYPISVENQWSRIFQKETGVLFLLLGSIMLWPDHAYLTTISVEIALVAALLLIVILREAIKPLFELFGLHLSWPTDKTIK